MPGMIKHTGKLAVYNEDNVDTDRIIPARFLSMVTRSGYGELLFNDVRNQDFVLNKPESKDASILVTGTNFGCGSSREHAVWAIQQAGFKVIIAKALPDSPGYSDIFRSNAANCGLCLIEINEESHNFLLQAGTGASVTVDLDNQTIDVSGQIIRFDMNEATRQQLMAGLDLIGTTMQLGDQISQFEGSWSSFSPSTVTPSS